MCVVIAEQLLGTFILLICPWTISKFQLALLCGAPGLGKTTLAHVIAKHAGYNVVEMNARWVAIKQKHSIKLQHWILPNLPCMCILIIMKCATIHILFSDDRSPEVFAHKIESSTQMQAVLTPNAKPNCLIIDEIDGAPTVSCDHAYNRKIWRGIEIWWFGGLPSQQPN